MSRVKSFWLRILTRKLPAFFQLREQARWAASLPLDHRREGLLDGSSGVLKGVGREESGRLRLAESVVNIAGLGNHAGIVVLGEVRTQDQLEIAVTEHLDHHHGIHPLLRHRRRPVLPKRVKDVPLLKSELPTYLPQPFGGIGFVKLCPPFGLEVSCPL